MKYEIVYQSVDEVSSRMDSRIIVGIFFALVLLGALLGLSYGVRPALTTYQNLKATHQSVKKGNLPEDEARATAIAALESEVGSLREEFWGGGISVPRRQLEAFVVNALDRTATQHDVSLLGITPDSSSSIWMFDELPYQVKVSGDYFSIHRWLVDLEDALRPMVIKQFKILPARQRTAAMSQEDVVVDLRIVAYRVSEEATS